MENRPSVLKGDHLFVTHSTDKDDKEYKGYVHEVLASQVCLGFADEYVQFVLVSFTGCLQIKSWKSTGI